MTVAKGLSVSDVSNVSVTLQASAAQGRNFGSMLILGSSTIIPISERIREYTSYDAIAADFGATAPESLAAEIYFSQSPQPEFCYVGRWVKTLATGETGTVETVTAAVQAMLGYNTWYGLHLADSASFATADLITIAGYIEAASASRIFAITSSDTGCMSATSTTDVAYMAKAAGYSRTFIQYSSTSSYAALSAFARGFTTDFTANNTTITLKFKTEPGVTYETITESQATALKGKNCNVYVYYNNDTAIIQEGTMANGDFFDERQGLDWLQNAVQTADFNTLYQSTTKIPQTDAGTTTRMAAIELIMDEAVNNGLLAPGVWTGGTIGSVSEGDTLTKGYYMYAEAVSAQSSSDRSARKGVPIQVAAKLAGAVHYSTVAITVVR